MKTPTQARPIRSCVMRATALVALCALTACGSLKEGLQQAVLIDYDQVNNFGKFELNQPVNVGNGQVVTEITAKGYWAYFVLCSLRNEGSKAQDFPYDVHNLHVDIDGQKLFYQKLQSGQWVHSAGIIDAPVSDQFQSDTLVGGTTHTFAPGFNSALNFRLAVFIPNDVKAPFDPKRLTLRYNGYPNVMTSRNHAAQPLEPGHKNALATVCRPSAQ